jgi:hypothetical protein
MLNAGSFTLIRSIAGALIMASATPLLGQTPPTSDALKLVDEGLGRSGTTQADGVRRYSFPRSDLDVRLDGVAIQPALALGSWLAFQPMGKQAMVMGDLVLTHDEVNPVMTELLRGGVQVTALHNHLLRSAPATMYLHVEAHGDPWTLAVALKSALAKSRTPLSAPPQGDPQPLGLDTAGLDRLIGRHGKANGGVYQFSIPRPDAPTSNGMPVPATMGTATAINFQAADAGSAAATGDFVLTAEQVDPVIRALRAANIEVTALHNHMLDDQPRLFFMHFWGHGDATKLGSGIRAALDAMTIKAGAANAG